MNVLCFIEALLSQFNCQRQRNLYISSNNPFFHSPTFKCQCIKNIHSRKSPPPFTCAFLSQKDQNGIHILSISRLLPRHIVTWVPKEEKNIGMALARMMGSNGPTVSGHFLCKISHPYHVWIVLPLNNQSNQCSRNKSNTYCQSLRKYKQNWKSTNVRSRLREHVFQTIFVLFILYCIIVLYCFCINVLFCHSLDLDMIGLRQV